MRRGAPMCMKMGGLRIVSSVTNYAPFSREAVGTTGRWYLQPYSLQPTPLPPNPFDFRFRDQVEADGLAVALEYSHLDLGLFQGL